MLAPETPSIESCAYVVLLYGIDAEYALGALLVAFTLRKAGALAKTLLLHSSDVPVARLPLLREFFDEVRLIAEPVKLPRDSPLCSCSRDFGHPQFMKLHLLELEFEKVLYLDCDVLVRRNLDHLFALEAPAAMDRIMAMPRHGDKLPNRVHYGASRIRGIQGGVMLLSPDIALFADMRAEVEDPKVLDEANYQSSIGNEQDYLTWKYCDGKLEEEGHKSVWTHLGCEYNYEIHEDSRYYGIGRERWLWLDYERDAAVLHFSAPFRKRAKQLLAPRKFRDSVGEEFAFDGSVVEDPRVAWAHCVWDSDVELLREAVKARGHDLMHWLGEGPGAHRAEFVIVDADSGNADIDVVGGEGMEIVQAGLEGLRFVRLRFEACTANCGEDLSFFPPSFAPGPPWGVCFWAQAGSAAEDLGRGSYGRREPDCSTTASSGGSPDGEHNAAPSGTCQIAAPAETVSVGDTSADDVADGATSEGGERRVHPGDPSGQAYTLEEFQRFSKESNMPTWYGKVLWRQAGGEDPTAEEVAVCNCAIGIFNDAAKRHREAPVQKEPTPDGLEEIGAWIRMVGQERWAFGRIAEPPHFPGCGHWRLATTFHAKVLAGETKAAVD